MKTIIYREFLDYMKSARFMVLLCMSVVLFAFNGLITVRDSPAVNTDREQYISTVFTVLHLPQNLLSFIAEGGERFSPASYRLSPKGFIQPEYKQEVNRKFPDFPVIDWIFIIKIVFGLYVLLLGYSAVAGERETGTLRLILSNRISRARCLIAKYAAVMVTVGIPLLAGILINLIIIMLFRPEVFSTGNITRIAFVVAASLAYLSLFAFLSLMVSSLIADSSLVLLTLLAVWIVFIGIVPDVSGMLAERFSGVPGEYEFARNTGPVIQESVTSKLDDLMKRANEGEFTSAEELQLAANEVFEKGQMDIIRHYRDYDNAMDRQADIAVNFSRLSPASLFRNITEDITGRGDCADRHFRDAAAAYSVIYDDYILGKVGEIVPESMWSFSSSAVINNEYVHILSPRPVEYTGDKSDFPLFVPTIPSIGEGLLRGAKDIALLLLWNACLAVAAFAAFHRADVR